MESIIFSPFIFILGASVGSFLNVVIDRLYTRESIVSARSHCDSCGHVLCWYELVPLLSFIFQRGRCRECGHRLSFQYPLVEITTGVLFVLSFQRLVSVSTVFQPHSNFIPTAFLLPQWNTIGMQWEHVGMGLLATFYLWFLISSLIVIFVYDLKHYIIPDRVILPSILLASFFTFYLFLFTSASGWDFLNPWFSAIGAGLFFLALILVTRGRGMGGGDVKLAFLMGLVLGWPRLLWALYLAFVSGALVGLILIALKQKKFGQEIPFGPFLAGATLVVLLYGESLIKIFQRIFNF